MKTRHVSVKLLHTGPEGLTGRCDELGWNVRGGWPRVFLLDGRHWLYRVKMIPGGAIFRTDTGGLEVTVYVDAGP